MFHRLLIALASISVASALACSSAGPNISSSEDDLSSGGPSTTSSDCVGGTLESDACVLDSQWKVYAEDQCNAKNLVLASFQVVDPCASGGPSQQAIEPAATKVHYQCCPGVIDPK